MANVAVGIPAAPVPVKTPKKAAKATSKGEKKAKTPSTHPPVNEMIVAALKTLKERHGTSLQAVKKYIGANYQCDVVKLSPFIRKALKNGVANGKLVQTKGTGAAGSFKLKINPKLASGEKAKGRKSLAGGSKKAAKKAKPIVKRQAAKAKKAAAGVTALKQKSTKHSKSVAKKPKAPKPKKATGAKKAAAARK